MVQFKLERIEDTNGQPTDTLVKYSQPGINEPVEREEWCTVPELDRLFAACVQRWSGNWDLEKVIIAIRESPID